MIIIKSKIKKLNQRYKEQGIKKTCKWLFNYTKFKVINKKNLIYDYDHIKINSQEINDFKFKKGQNIFIFATVPFYDIGGGQRSAQMAKIFNKLGFNVYYIYAFCSSESNKFRLSIPCTMHRLVDKVKKENLVKIVNKDDLFIFEAPCNKFDQYIDVAKKKEALIIYENIDNWETNLGNILFCENTLKRFISEADILVGTSQLLVDQLDNYLTNYQTEQKTKLYLANAVDDELFNPDKKYKQPRDLVIGEKTLIYYGSLWGTWFDWNLIFKVAEEFPKFTINLIGDYNALTNLDNKPNNIYFLGIKKQNDLPAYLAYSDYALLPFKVDEIGKYVSPLKLFEYIAMNKKVLATCLPDIARYPNVYYGNNSEEWLKHLRQKDNEALVDNKNFIQENNWYDRCIKLIDEVNLKEARKCIAKYYDNVTIIILNYNNKKVIFNCIDLLLAHKERYNYEIVIVDNKSSDGSYELLTQKYKSTENVYIIQNNKNGCSSGRNLGVKKATNEYIVFLDSDQWTLNKYWLDNYLKLLDSDDNIGSIGWGAGWFNSDGYAYHIVDELENRGMYPNALARNDIGYLATCGFIMAKELFDKIEGFDEEYDPTCYEDTDLSLKIRNAGKEIYYCPYLGVGHLAHQTTKSGTNEHESLIYKKGTYFVNKWKKIDINLLNYIK